MWSVCGRVAARESGLALLDAEAVLLVDDGDGELAEIDACLDERVRADDDGRRRPRCSRPPLLPRGQELVSRPARDAELRAERLEREEVLLGERLRGRHERPAEAGLDRAQQRVERDDRLPRADVALQEPLHRHRAREVGVELGDGLLLGRGQRERQRLP